MDETTPKHHTFVEVSVGWNSSSPKRDFQFSDSPVTCDLTVKPQVIKSDDSQENGDISKGDIPTSGVLGKYGALLPGSSPPKPRIYLKKRKPESPLKRKIGGYHLKDTKFDQIEEIEPNKPFEIVQPLNTSQLDTTFNTKPKLNISIDNDSSDSELDALLKAPVPIPFSSSYFYNRKVRRFTVQSLNDQHDCLNVHCINIKGECVTIKITGSWYMHTKIERGDNLHLFSPSNSQSFVVNDENDILLIVNPDILVPCTSVSESLSCERQVVLRTQIRVPSDLNENLVLGSIKHEFIQLCFTENLISDEKKMLEALKKSTERFALDLKLVHLEIEDAISILEPLVRALQQWAIPIWGNNAIGKTVPMHRGSDRVTLKLIKAVKTEEEIRSPFLGLVGKIDITCEAINPTECKVDTNQNIVTKIVALEIKTGRFTQSTAHRAQAALYALLLSERYPNNAMAYSLLYYTVDGTIMAVASLQSELKILIQKRNTIARDLWLAPPSSLPIPLSATEMSCKWCSRKNSCTIFTALNGGELATFGKSILKDNYFEALEANKLSQHFLKFLQHWHHLIQLEYDIDHKYERLKSRQWWTVQSQAPVWKVVKQEHLSDSIQGYIYLMEMKPIASSQDSVILAADHSTHPYMMDERVIISTQHHMGVSFGVVTSILTGNKMQIWVQDMLYVNGKYRIDRDPWISDLNVGLARFNLNSLLEHDRLRELLVDLVKPQFYSLSDKKFQNTLEWASSRVLNTPDKNNKCHGDLLSTSSDEDDVQIGNEHANLNEDQTMALNKVLGAQDYALILGMPGTGKTTTIAAIVASLVRRGKTVLVTAYTNSAVDTLVLKLISANVPTLRLAASLKDVHKGVIPVSVSTTNTNDISRKRLVEFSTCSVVACTSHLTGNKLFALRNFDYCILDEASQITLPFCIGPLRLANTFVLVGDHYQLPPLVRNNIARELGLSESLFKILCEAHPDSVIELTKQYRMCSDIMSLSSDLVYNGRLTCGTQLVADQKLHLPYFEFKQNGMKNYAAINPENRVIFLNTDVFGSKAHEIVHTQGSSNKAEAEVIKNIVIDLLNSGLKMDDVAVISVYRKQLNLLTELLNEMITRGLEVLTADQAQGRDKKCIFVSLVRSNEEINSGELLKDWRRLNVAFTRAKQKLIIVGSKQVMKCADGVARFFEYIEKRGWVYDAQL